MATATRAKAGATGGMRRANPAQGARHVSRKTARQPAAPCAECPPARRGGSADRTSEPAMSAMTSMTIGRLAQAAEVGVETVRYYQRRGLLPQPQPTRGAYRHYPPEVAARLRFIRRAQQLGFTLDEIASLLQLSDGTDRRSIRRITAARLAQLQERMADMQKMADVLQHLLHACEHASGATRCPIIESIGALPLAPGHGASA
jgi:MerR family transcriptional regulator, mercuric resistance operon regulatory protein